MATETKKWHDMTPQELARLEIQYEDHIARANTAINLLREHMKERGLQLKPQFYGF